MKLAFEANPRMHWLAVMIDSNTSTADTNKDKGENK